MNIETFISDAVRRSVETLYGELGDEQLQIQKTRREFEGDYTLVTFPLLRRSRKSPEATATEIGEYMAANVPEIASFNVIKGFLNLSLDSAFWAARFAEVVADERFGQAPATGRTGDGRVLVAQHQQAAPPGPYPQQSAGLLRGADSQGQWPYGHQGQPGERPRHPHLQVDAGVETVRKRRNPRLVGDEGRSPRGQVLRGVRQTLQGADQGAGCAGTAGGRGQEKRPDHAPGAGDAAQVGGP